MFNAKGAFPSGKLEDDNADRNADKGGPASVLSEGCKYSIETWDEGIHVMFWLESGQGVLLNCRKRISCH